MLRKLNSLPALCDLTSLSSLTCLLTIHLVPLSCSHASLLASQTAHGHSSSFYACHTCLERYFPDLLCGWFWPWSLKHFSCSVPVCHLVMSDFFWPHELYSLPNPSVHGIFQVRILEWVARSLSRGSSQHRSQTWVPHIAGRFFIVWAITEAYHCHFPSSVVFKALTIAWCCLMHLFNYCVSLPLSLPLPEWKPHETHENSYISHLVSLLHPLHHHLVRTQR